MKDDFGVPLWGIALPIAITIYTMFSGPIMQKIQNMLPSKLTMISSKKGFQSRAGSASGENSSADQETPAAPAQVPVYIQVECSKCEGTGEK